MPPITDEPYRISPAGYRRIASDTRHATTLLADLLEPGEQQELDSIVRWAENRFWQATRGEALGRLRWTAGSFAIVTGTDDESHVVLTAGNGQVVLTGGPFEDRRIAFATIDAIRLNSRVAARYDLIDMPGGTYFILRDATGAELAHSSVYRTRAGCLGGRQGVRRLVALAGVVELSVTGWLGPGTLEDERG